MRPFFRQVDGDFTLSLQKLGMPQMHDVKGLAVVIYAEPLTTKQMRYRQLSRRINNRAIMALFLDSTRRDF